MSLNIFITMAASSYGMPLAEFIDAHRRPLWGTNLPLGF